MLRRPPHIHSSKRPVTMSAVVIFHRDLVLKKSTADRTEAIHYARLSCSKQLPNAVIFIWFIDKKSI